MEDWIKIALGVPAFLAVAITLPFVFQKSRLEVRKLRLEIEKLEKRKTAEEKKEILQETIEENPIIFFSKLATYIGLLALISFFFFGTYIKAISITLYFAVALSTLSGVVVVTTDIALFGTLWQTYRNWRRKKRLTNTF